VWNPPVRADVRYISWEKDTSEEILRKIRSADGQPGASGRLMNREFYLFNACEEEKLRGKPGEVIAIRDEAVCVGTLDGAIWITHLRERRRNSIKLPALRLLPELADTVPEVPIDPWESVTFRTYREIVYEEEEGIGYIHFRFYNGAMSTEQCLRLTRALKYAKRRPVKAIVLLGQEDFFSNGINLNTIENAESPADESWRNINAMNDLCEEILNTCDRLTVAALQGNAGAGGFFLALTCDQIFGQR